MIKKLFQFVTLMLITTPIMAADNPTLHLTLSTGGTVDIELYEDIAPKHIERITTLAKEGFYDGIIFHRVIDNFMAQAGDPTGTGMSGSSYPDLKAEFNDKNFDRGVVGMARKGQPDTANSQFFICFDDCSFLNGQYTVFGKVTNGMDYVDALPKGEPPRKPGSIIKATIKE